VLGRGAGSVRIRCGLSAICG